MDKKAYNLFSDENSMKKLLLAGLVLLTCGCAQFVNEQPKHQEKPVRKTYVHKKQVLKNKIMPAFHTEKENGFALALFKAGCTQGAYWHVREWYRQEMGLDPSPDVINSEINEMWINRNKYENGRLWNKFGKSKDDIFAGYAYKFHPNLDTLYFQLVE